MIVVQISDVCISAAITLYALSRVGREIDEKNYRNILFNPSGGNNRSKCFHPALTFQPRDNDVYRDCSDSCYGVDTLDLGANRYFDDYHTEKIYSQLRIPGGYS